MKIIKQTLLLLAFLFANYGFSQTQEILKILNRELETQVARVIKELKQKEIVALIAYLQSRPLNHLILKRGIKLVALCINSCYESSCFFVCTFPKRLR